jgi:putative ABC transport system permease protein
MNDLRHALRLFRTSPAFHLVCVLALAIGIGANTAIFSMVNAVLLRELEFKKPEELVWIWSTRTDRDKAFFSIPNFLEYREQTRSLQEIAAFAHWGANLTEGSNPERVAGVRVTANAFQMLGVEAAAGRCFLPDDGTPTASRTVLVSYGLWQRRFAGERELVGKSITLNGDSYTVVGILPASFRFPGAEIDVAIPLVFETHPRRTERGTNFLRVFARMKSGVTPRQVYSEMESIWRGLQEQYPQENAKNTAPNIVPLRQEIVGASRTSLFMLLGAVGLVLLIACANLANLLLSRASARRKEMAIRAALGASRKRLVRQLLVETGLLTLLGGALGLFLAWQGTAFLARLSPQTLPRAHEIDIDGRVLAFTLLASAASALIFGLIPALQATKVDLNEALQGSGKGGTDTGMREGTRSLLVVSEIALSLVLLVTAALFVKSFLRLQEVSPGFQGENVLLTTLSLPAPKYSDRAAVSLFFDKLLPRLETLPGVSAVGVTNVAPLSQMNVRNDFTIAGRPPLTVADKPGAQSRWVSPDYFRAMGIPLVRGRAFTPQDKADASAVVIIDEALGRRLWPNADPVGAHLILEEGTQRREVEIVGVVASVKHFTLDEEPMATYYAPVAQLAPAAVSFFAGSCTLAIKTASNPLGLEAAVRREIQGIDKDVPMANTKTMEQVLAISIGARRFSLLLLGLFSVVAVVLAVTGVYAVMAYSVVRRQQEIGIRIALGAQSRDVLRLVLGRAVRLVLIGVVAGTAGAIASTRLVSSLLFGVSALDPAVFAVAAALLALVGISASYLPARRATTVDPIVALRAQ